MLKLTGHTRYAYSLIVERKDYSWPLTPLRTGSILPGANAKCSISSATSTRPRSHQCRAAAADVGARRGARGRAPATSRSITRLWFQAWDGVMASLGASSSLSSRVCCQSLSATGSGSMLRFCHQAASPPDRCSSR